MNKIGLFGGTFDPIHIGHITIANCFVAKCELDVCYFIPTNSSPFKINAPKMLTDNERISKIEYEIISNPLFSLCKFEIENPALSYTINTIKYFSNKFPDASLYLLIGADQALKFNKWKDYDKILELVEIVIATRPEKLDDNDIALIDSIFKNHNYSWLGNPIINITSSEIRKLAKLNNNLSDIEQQNLA